VITADDLSRWVLQNFLTVLASAGSLVATGAVVYSLIVLRNQLRLQVFLEYTRRFDEISFPEGAFAEPWPSLTKRRARKAERAFRKYFDLWRERVYQIKYAEYLDDLAQIEEDEDAEGLWEISCEASGYWRN
jgi:hypothetical protein